MAQVGIRINGGNPGTPVLNHPLDNQPVTLSNLGDGSETTYDWQVVDAPDNGVTNATATNQPTFTFTPAERGTYLVRLTVNANTPGATTGTTILAIRHNYLRVPAVREQLEAGTDGWGASLQEALVLLDGSLTNGITQYGTAVELSDVTSAAKEAGVLNKAARADHKHDISVAAGLDIGSLDEQGGLGTSSALARSDHQHGTTPQNPGTAMGSDLSAWKLYSTDAIIQQKLLTQGIVLIAQATDMSAVDPNCHIVLANTSVAGFTLTLPAAAGTMQETNLGRLLRIKNIGTNNLTISPATGNTIDGAGGVVVPQGGAADLVSDGAGWWVMGRNPEPGAVLRAEQQELVRLVHSYEVFAGFEVICQLQMAPIYGPRFVQTLKIPVPPYQLDFLDYRVPICLNAPARPNDGTPYSASLTPSDESAGIIKLTVIATDASDASQSYHAEVWQPYHKSSGTVTFVGAPVPAITPPADPMNLVGNDPFVLNAAGGDILWGAVNPTVGPPSLNVTVYLQILAHNWAPP